MGCAMHNWSVYVLAETWLNACRLFFFFFNDTATTEIYTLSLHDALPISTPSAAYPATRATRTTRATPYCRAGESAAAMLVDRKSTRLNSSHSQISYAVFCLKKKTKKKHRQQSRERKTPKNDKAQVVTAKRQT